MGSLPYFRIAASKPARALSRSRSIAAAAVWATSRYFTFAGELGAGMSASQSLARFARSGSLPKRSCVSSSAIAATAVSDRARGFAARDAARWSAIASASAKLSLARPS